MVKSLLHKKCLLILFLLLKVYWLSSADNEGDDFAVPWGDVPYWTDVVTSKPEGYKESGDTIYISTAEGLSWLSSVSNGLNGNAATDFDGKCVVLLDNLDISDYEWYPIGSVKGFAGTFNGNGRFLRGLVITKRTGRYVALFVKNTGVIENLSMRNSNVSVKITTDVCDLAALVSVNSEGAVVRNCENDGLVELISANTAGCNVGGIAAYNYGTVDACVNKGTVIFDYANCFNFCDYQATGGVVGWTKETGLISNCMNYSSVYGCSCVGGVAGYGSSIINSANRGFVTGNGTYKGGLVGVGSGVYNCYNTGYIQGGAGIVGYENKAANGMANCYNASSQGYRGGGDVFVAKHIYWDGDSVSMKNDVNRFACSFSKYSDGLVLSEKVFEHTDLVNVLNSWVVESGNSSYCYWADDSANVNGGYPILVNVLSWKDTLSGPDDYKTGEPVLPPSNAQKRPVEGVWQDIVTSKPEGYRESGDTIYISTAEGLSWLSSESNGFTGNGFKSFEGKHIILTANVDMSGHEFVPISGNGVCFKGAFDGRSHTIKGLVISDLAKGRINSGWLAFVSELEDGTLRNIILDDVLVSCEDTIGSASLIGRRYSGMVQNCHSKGVVRGRGNVSGLICSAVGYTIDCSVSGSVLSLGRNLKKGRTLVAGLVADACGFVERCINYAYVDGCDVAAGLVAYGSSVCISNSANHGYISADNLAGGLLGYSFESELTNTYLLNSYNSGTIENGYGLCAGSDRHKQNISMRNCYDVGCPYVDYNRAEESKISHVYWGGACGLHTNDTLAISMFEKNDGKNCSFIYEDYSPNIVDVNCRECDYNDTLLYGFKTSTDNLEDALNLWVEFSELIPKESIDISFVSGNGFIMTAEMHYSRWRQVSDVNNGYPILSDVPYTAESPINETDTTFTVCSGVMYGDRSYSMADHGKVLPLQLGNEIFPNALILVKHNSFSGVNMDVPEFFCEGEVVELYASGADSYRWVVNGRELSDNDTCIVHSDSFRTACIELEVMKGGCPKSFYDTLEVADSVLVEMKGWGDVLVLDNSESMFVSYQWYRDGELLPNETKQYYYEPNGLTPGIYSVQIKTRDNSRAKVCPLEVFADSLKSGIGLRSYPVPANDEEPFFVEVEEEDLNGTELVIYDEKGNLVRKINAVRRKNEMRLPSGVYVVVLERAGTPLLSTKLIVRE